MNSKSNLISLWLKSSVNPRFSNNNNDQVLEDDDMEEPPVIREFSLIPHQQDEELSDNEVEQNKINNNNNGLNGASIIDSINEIFENHGWSLLDQCSQPMKVLKSNKKIHKKNIDCWLNKNSEIRIKIAKISDSIERARVSKPQVVSEIKHSPESKNKLSSNVKSQQMSAEKSSSSSSKKRVTKLMQKSSELSDQDLIESIGDFNSNSQSNAIRASLRNRKKENKAEECKGWTWKKSQWIKLYCEWFISKGFWSPSCSWEDWFNMEENEEEINKIRKKIASRNPHAFQSKVKVDEINQNLSEGESKLSNQDKKIHIKGCNCKKSQCSNNYWECHQNGAKWTELWAWSDWKNND